MKGKILLILLILLFFSNMSGQQMTKDKIKFFTKGTMIKVPSLPSGFSKVLKAANNQVIFSEDFENPVNWTIDTLVWEIGTPSYGPSSAYQGDNVAATKLDNNYSSGVDGRLMSPVIQLPVLGNEKEHLYLEYYNWYQIESDYDKGFVEISIDGHNWIQVYEITGESNDWVKEQIILDDYAGQSIQIAFRFTSDWSVTYAGWYLDVVKVLYYQPSPVDVEILALDHSLFPWIFLTARVDSFGVPSNSLDASYFQVNENGILQTEGFQVTPPGSGNRQRVVDVLFLMDNSGSMDDEQEAVRRNVHNFVTQLMASGANSALGLIRFGGHENGGNPILENNGQITQDTSYFLDVLWAKNYADGSFEPGWDAIYMAATQFKFRPGALKVVVLITDETPTDDDNVGQFTYNQALRAALDNQLHIFAMIDLNEPHSYDDYGTLAEKTGGEYYSVIDPMDGILQAIGSVVTGNYIIRYKSSDPTPSGQREVVLTVNAFNSTANDTAYYTPGTNITLQLTDSTETIIANQQPIRNPIPISVIVDDPTPPYVHQVTLYYKNLKDNFYQYVGMSPTPYDPQIWQANIPEAAVDTPAVQFYIEAKDSTSIETLPSVLPQKNPFEIAIYPNYVPFIYHFPVVQSMGDSIPIIAAVYDVTNMVDSCFINFRNEGEILWQKFPMYRLPQATVKNFARMVALNFSVDENMIVDSLLNEARQRGHVLNENTLLDVFKYNIIHPDPSIQRIWYYLQAVDDFGTSGFDGFQNNPYQIDFLFDIFKYAPVLYFHENERYFPISVENLFRNSDLMEYKGCFPYENVSKISSMIQTSQLKNWRYIQLKKFYYQNDEIPLNYDYTGYYNIYTDTLRNRRVIQYWFLYPYNVSPVNVHEGDWEHVDVIFEPINAKEPSRLITSFHNYYFVYNWDEVRFQNGHPIVYVDLASHAMAAKREDCARNSVLIISKFGASTVCSHVPGTVTALTLIEDILTGGGGAIDDPISIAFGILLEASCEAFLPYVTSIVYDRSLTPEKKEQIFRNITNICNFSENGTQLEPSGFSSANTYSLKPIQKSWGATNVHWGAKWTRASHELDTYALPLDYFHDTWGGFVFNVGDAPIVFYQSGPIGPVHSRRPMPGEYDIVAGNLAKPPQSPTTIFDLPSNLNVEILVNGSGARKIFATNSIKKTCNDTTIDFELSQFNYADRQVWIIKSYQTITGKILITPSSEFVKKWQLKISNYTRCPDEKNFRFSGTFEQDSLVTIPFTILVKQDKTTDLIISSNTFPPLSAKTIYAYPNPFIINKHEGVTIRYSIDKPAEVSIYVYDFSGFLVKTLKQNEFQSNNIQHAILWDGTNDKGQFVANGVYFYKIITSKNEKAVGKILVVR